MKGLVSADGNRKEAWYIMNEYYKKEKVIYEKRFHFNGLVSVCICFRMFCQ